MKVVVEKRKSESKFALKNKSYRIYTWGNFFSRLGEWIDYTVLNWAVLAYTHSPFYLAVINACRLIPVFLASIPAGVMADRWNQRKVLVRCQCVVLLLTCILALIPFDSCFWLMAGIVTLRSLFSAIDLPIRNTYITTLVSEQHMASAISLNALVLNLSRIMGPALAGFLLTKYEASDLFWLNAWSIGVYILTLLIMPREEDSPAQMKSIHLKQDISEAVQYIRSNPVVQSLFILAIVPMIFGFPYTSMMPLFAKHLMQLNADGFGLLLSASGMGAILCSSFLSTGKWMADGKRLILSIFFFGFFLTCFMFAHTLLIAVIMMFFIGFMGQCYRTMSRVSIQAVVPDELRGRIVSIAMMDRGLIPFGSLIISLVADVFGALWAGLLMGLGCMFISLIVAVYWRQIWDFTCRKDREAC
ncbi:MFS transporter [Thermoflavimicrobium dichotomicum]|uniref:Predicted arabinose efflux permease, MFS family n=1 Tax=Thermoflavimicrobium dichotomicum TaxID=46223 RepID=A0A1I3MEI8_9BACL|nr:MFS transporter [Thermoflavimicrobium dichotomicum]SFI95362.1 Predicted arabinose efflux permease, MFS family [Thermoflavimicrobium dichotomicum]